MKKALLAILCCLPLQALAQGSYAVFPVQTANGQAIAGATIALCSSTQPSTVTPCDGSSLQQTYTGNTGTPCTLNSPTLGPTYGTGCTNPGLTDGFGMARLYAAPNAADQTYYYQAYGQGILVTDVEPILFPGGNIPNPIPSITVNPGPLTVDGGVNVLPNAQPFFVMSCDPFVAFLGSLGQAQLGALQPTGLGPCVPVWNDGSPVPGANNFIPFIQQDYAQGDIPVCSVYVGGYCQQWVVVVGGTGLLQEVNGVATLAGYPFCPGFAPTNGQYVSFTTSGTGAPCLTPGTPSGTYTGTKGQATVASATNTPGTTVAAVYASSYCGSTTSCNPGSGITNEGLALQAIETAVNGPISIIDDMCGLQYWSVNWATKPGQVIDQHNCPTSNPHIIKLDGMSTFITPSAFRFIGMGAGGQAYPSAAVNTFISGCNPAVETCPLGGFQQQHGTISTVTVSGDVMTVTVSGAPFTTCAANGVCSNNTSVNAMQQYRRGCIVAASIINENGCWLYDTTVSYNGNQSFSFYAVSGVTNPCASGCTGTLVLDTPIVMIGKGGGVPTVYHTSFDNLQVDANYIPGSEGIVNGQGEEDTYASRMQVWNATADYIRCDTSNAYGGGSTGSANSTCGYDWAGNMANTTCAIAAGCTCQQPLTAVVNYTNSGHQITWVSGSQFPFSISTVALAGTTGGPFTINQNSGAVAASGTTLTYTGTASPSTGSNVTATLYNAGMTACAANSTPGTAPLGTFMGCGNGGTGSTNSSGQPIVSQYGGDPCYNPNFVGYLLTGTTGNQGGGTIGGHTTNSISDKSNGGGHGIYQMDGIGATQAIGFGIFGDHGGFDDSHTEYTNVGAEICGNSALNATWEEAYSGVPTEGVILKGGFWNVTNIASAGVGVDIGQSGAGSTCQNIWLIGLDIGSGTGGPTFSDNVNGNTCSDQTISYVLGNPTNPVLMNSCTTGTGVNTPMIFSALPSCVTALKGKMQVVTDSTTVVFNATITGSGSNVVNALCNGTNWTVH